ncbi:hypothetical protein [Bacillus alkalicola]|uniref:Uncharacterized protein n=1 Tax=Evansella alkalicola TaxID=745819 RepID=A0ABS6JQP5_9BACI|nr:hypothetical protein [Bacillus alkalicola]MBU9720864.1 hypothetical protein [Bacillus alkalicola]
MVNRAFLEEGEMLFFVEGIGIKQLVHMLRDLYEFWPKKQVGGLGEKQWKN